MKKFVSIALAIVMVLSVSVSAFAVEIDDEYVASIASEGLFSFTVLFPMDNGWWDTDGGFTSSDDEADDFIAAINTEGAKIIIKTDADVETTPEDNPGYQYGIQKTSDDYYFVAVSFYHESRGEGDMGADEVVVEGDYAYVIADAATFVAACEAAEVDWSAWQWVNGASVGHKTYGVYVIIPASSESTEETTEEVSSEASETSETTESSESSETSTASSPDTGVALALVPMALAGIAVVSSKRR